VGQAPDRRSDRLVQLTQPTRESGRQSGPDEVVPARRDEQPRILGCRGREVDNRQVGGSRRRLNWLASRFGGGQKSFGERGTARIEITSLSSRSAGGRG
jgi:hypothetical protein